MKSEGSRHSPVSMHKCSQGKAKKGRNRGKESGSEGGERGEGRRWPVLYTVLMSCSGVFDRPTVHL